MLKIRIFIEVYFLWKTSDIAMEGPWQVLFLKKFLWMAFYISALKSTDVIPMEGIGLQTMVVRRVFHRRPLECKMLLKVSYLPKIPVKSFV